MMADLLPPAPGGEPFMLYLQRTIAGVRGLLAAGASVGLRPVRLVLLRPAELTVEWWLKEWPERSFGLMDEQTDGVTYRYRRALWELIVVLFHELRPHRKLVMHGYRADNPDAMQMVPPVLWEHPEMQVNLQAHDVTFGPETRRGQPVAVAKLPTYFGLTVHGAPSFIAPAHVSPTPANWEALVKRHQGKDKIMLALAQWADKFGDKLPNRHHMLEAHRAEFGIIRGITDLTMRKLRKYLVSIGRIPVRSTRGGAAMHEKRRGL
jgi:hypothetical protein